MRRCGGPAACAGLPHFIYIKDLSICEFRCPQGVLEPMLPSHQGTTIVKFQGSRGYTRMFDLAGALTPVLFIRVFHYQGDTTWGCLGTGQCIRAGSASDPWGSSEAPSSRGPISNTLESFVFPQVPKQQLGLWQDNQSDPACWVRRRSPGEAGETRMRRGAPRLASGWEALPGFPGAGDPAGLTAGTVPGRAQWAGAADVHSVRLRRLAHPLPVLGWEALSRWPAP